MNHVHDIKYIKIAPTGSHHICSPPVENTDIDYIVLLHEQQLDDAVNELTDSGWELGGSVGGGCCAPRETYFQSLKKGKINYIVTAHPEFYDKFCKATEIAKDLNLLNKKDRVALFRMVMREFYE